MGNYKGHSDNAIWFRYDWVTIADLSFILTSVAWNIHPIGVSVSLIYIIQNNAYILDLSYESQLWHSIELLLPLISHPFTPYCYSLFFPIHFFNCVINISKGIYAHKRVVWLSVDWVKALILPMYMCPGSSPRPFFFFLPHCSCKWIPFSKQTWNIRIHKRTISSLQIEICLKFCPCNKACYPPSWTRSFVVAPSSGSPTLPSMQWFVHNWSFLFIDCTAPLQTS